MVETTNIPHGNRRELIHSVLPKVAPSEFPEIAPSQDFAAERVLEVYPIQAPEVSPGQGLEVAPQPWPHLEIDIRQIRRASRDIHRVGLMADNISPHSQI